MSEVLVVPIAQIKTDEDRLRDDLGDLSSLEESLKSFMGQLHPLAVQATAVEGEYKLIAGERRLTALKNIGKDSVAVRIFPAELSPLQVREIELTENIARLNLTWQEQVKATKALHDLKLEQHGGIEKTGGKSEGWSKAGTAGILGVSPVTLLRDLDLAEMIESVPELAKCKTKQEATTVAAKLEERLIMQELSRRHEEGHAKTSLDEYAKAFRLGNFFDAYMTDEIEHGSFDLIEADPPYDIGIKQQSPSGKASRSRSTAARVVHMQDYIDSQKEWESYQEFIGALCRACYELLKPDGWLLLWFSQHPHGPMIAHELEAVGFELVRSPGIWCKDVRGSEGTSKSPIQARSGAPDKMLSNIYEPFYYARKGNAIIRKRGRLNIWHYSPPSAQNRSHPTEKTIPLMQDILETFAMPNAKVLVPFLGSGNTLLAAWRAKMSALGYELSEAYKGKFIMNMQKELGEQNA